MVLLAMVNMLLLLLGFLIRLRKKVGDTTNQSSTILALDASAEPQKG